jgi:hypothetical protein
MNPDNPEELSITDEEIEELLEYIQFGNKQK